MAFTVFIIGGHLTKHPDLSAQLLEHGFQVHNCGRWAELAGKAKGPISGPNALVFDLDSEPIGLADLRRLMKDHPNSHLLATASHSYNPDKAECIEKHLFALLKKPLDPEELIYLLGCLSKLEEKHDQEADDDIEPRGE